RRQLEVALSRRGFGDVVIAPLMRAQPGERRRADFGIERVGKEIVIGFHAYRSRTLVDMQDCAVLAPQIVALLPALRQLVRGLLGNRGSADLLLTRTESGIDLLIGGTPSPERAQREAIAAFATTHDLARIAHRRGDETPEVLIQRRVP